MGFRYIMEVANAIVIPEINRLLREGHEVVFTPEGQSMRPFIHGGQDSVTLVQPSRLTVGDILLCEPTPHQYVLHRLIAIDGERLTLMGDANLQGTEHCAPCDVIGKVITITHPDGSTRRPGKARLWRWFLPLRPWLLKLYRRYENQTRIQTSPFRG